MSEVSKFGMGSFAVQFSYHPYIISISGHLLVHFTLLLFQTVKATSLLGDPRVTYNMEEGLVSETNNPIRFYLKTNRTDSSASILVSEPLDYEETKFFTLKIRAQNVATVPLASFTTVYVNLTGMLHLIFDLSVKASSIGKITKVQVSQSSLEVQSYLTVSLTID